MASLRPHLATGFKLRWCSWGASPAQMEKLTSPFRWCQNSTPLQRTASEVYSVVSEMKVFIQTQAEKISVFITKEEESLVTQPTRNCFIPTVKNSSGRAAESAAASAHRSRCSRQGELWSQANPRYTVSEGQPLAPGRQRKVHYCPPTIRNLLVTPLLPEEK